MVVHAFNPGTQEAEAGGSEFEGSLVYRVSSRIGRATRRNYPLKKIVVVLVIIIIIIKRSQYLAGGGRRIRSSKPP